MSLGPGYRAATIGLATAASLFAGVARADSSFTPSQCKLIAGVASEVMTKVGAANLSSQFRTSLADFIMPSVSGVRHMTCDGRKDILTPLGNDIDAYNTMRDILLAPPARISLVNAGLRSVDPKELAARDLRRSELPAARPGG